MENVAALSLLRNRINSLEENVFHNMPKLKFLNLANNDLGESPKARVSPLAFRSTSLRRIDLSSNNKFKRKGDLKNIFRNIQQPTAFYLEKCPASSAYREAFQNLKSLSTLIVREVVNFDRYAGRSMFTNLSSLKYLYLARNDLKSLDSRMFDGMKSLKQSDVHSNRFTTVTAEYLPVKVQARLRRVDFSDNPFVCDCNII